MSEKIGIRPLRDKVVVERDEAQSETAGGLTIPKEAKEKPVRGTVRAAGPGISKEDPMMVKVDDIVLFGKHSGIEVEIDGDPYLVMREIDLFPEILHV